MKAAVERKKDTKQKILEATLRLISEKGYLGATTREIAQQVGVAELTLFRHFGSKEKLFEEVLENFTFLPRLKELLPELEGLPCEEALNAIGLHFIGTLKERRSFIRIMITEVTVYPEKARQLYHGMIDGIIKTLAGYFRGLQADGVLKKEIVPEVAARFFLGTMFQYFHSEEIIKGHTISKQDARKTVGELVGIFTSGVFDK